MNMKALIAELVGTFCLTFAVLSSTGADWPVATPLIAALCLMMFVYTIGGISGCHINPAVTIGLMTIRKIGATDGIAYIFAQVIGAAIAATLFGTLGPVDPETGSVKFVSLALGDGISPLKLLAEAMGMFFFTFGISAAVHEKIPESMSGVVVGGSLLLGIVVAAHSASGVLNPAVSIGISNFNFQVAYLVGPIVGSIAGFFFGKFVHEDW